MEIKSWSSIDDNSVALEFTMEIEEYDDLMEKLKPGCMMYDGHGNIIYDEKFIDEFDVKTTSLLNIRVLAKEKFKSTFIEALGIEKFIVSDTQLVWATFPTNYDNYDCAIEMSVSIVEDEHLKVFEELKRYWTLLGLNVSQYLEFGNQVSPEIVELIIECGELYCDLDNTIFSTDRLVLKKYLKEQLMPHGVPERKISDIKKLKDVIEQINDIYNKLYNLQYETESKLVRSLYKDIATSKLFNMGFVIKNFYRLKYLCDLICKHLDSKNAPINITSSIMEVLQKINLT